VQFVERVQQQGRAAERLAEEQCRAEMARNNMGSVDEIVFGRDTDGSGAAESPAEKERVASYLVPGQRRAEPDRWRRRLPTLPSTPRLRLGLSVSLSLSLSLLLSPTLTLTLALTRWNRNFRSEAAEINFGGEAPSPDPDPNPNPNPNPNRNPNQAPSPDPLSEQLRSAGHLNSRNRHGTSTSLHHGTQALLPTIQPQPQP